MGNRDKNRRLPSAEELALWDIITGHTKPAALGDSAEAAEEDMMAFYNEVADNHRENGDKKGGSKKQSRQAGSNSHIRTGTSCTMGGKTNIGIQIIRGDTGNIPGLNRQMAEKLRKGKLPIEARLDLHGMTQEVAFNSLIDFVKDAYLKQKRMLLIITGKGRDAPAGAGVLKKALPVWLNDSQIYPLILACCEAQPADGGNGAVYLLLKRQRG